MLILAALMISLLMTIAGTQLIRKYALKNLLDIPNQRSSHQSPTPTGGGLAIVVVFYSLLGSFFLFGFVQLTQCLVLMTGGAVAAIGFCDDHKPIAARWRFLVHTISALLALLLMHGLPSLQWGGVNINFGVIGYGIGLLFLVWLLNLFNFMDGIDGIAGAEVVFVCTALAGFMIHTNSSLALLALAVAICSLGFLFVNWPPASIFMGDVGSGFLGFVIGLLILLFGHEDANFITIGLILFAVFISDATYTLLYRVYDGQKWFEAHCSHAYQHAAKLKGHRCIVLSITLINIFWLLPWAIWGYLQPQYAQLSLVVAYIPLLFIAKKLAAGVQAT